MRRTTGDTGRRGAYVLRMPTTDPKLVLAGYDATDEGADGLALARLLADLTHRRLFVARVIPDVPDHPGLTRPEQLHTREVVAATHEAILAAVPDGDVEVLPVLEPSVVKGLHDVADAQGAAMLVLGSSHHTTVGRVLLGGTIDTLVNHAPCPVAVAPPGFREQPILDPGVIGIAWDGSDTARAAMRVAVELTAVTGLPLRVVTITPSLLDRPAENVPVPARDGIALARDLAGDAVEVDGLERSGNPGHELAAVTRDEVGLLVVGSHQRATATRILLGSVSLAVVRHAHAPVLVVPGT